MATCALRSCVLLLATTTCFAVDTHPQSKCSEISHHPENGGYYIEGVDGVNNDDRHEETGRRKDSTLWAPDKYYPHMEKVLCTGRFCSEEARVNGTEQVVTTHTCALLRFSYDAPSNVYEMKDREHFDLCDFTDAVLRGASDAGQPHYDYVIDEDAEKTHYFFASDPGCNKGQRVAFHVVEDYAKNAAQCKSMGLGSSRIQNCDCNHAFKPTTLIDPCFTAFRLGCLSDMPDDQSCCNADTTYAEGKFKNCGTCIPKSKEQAMMQTIEDTMSLCESNKTTCEAYSALESCPSRYSGKHDPMCDVWKAVQTCKGATGEDLAACDCDMNWVVYQKYMMTTTSSTASATELSKEDVSGASTMQLAKLIAITLALAYTR